MNLTPEQKAMLFLYGEETAIVFTVDTVMEMERAGLLKFSPEANRYQLTELGHIRRNAIIDEVRRRIMSEEAWREATPARKAYAGQPHPFRQGESIAPRCADCGAGPDNAIHKERREGERREPPPLLTHTYPEGMEPGKGVAFLDDAWRCLDQLEPGALSQDARAWIAGLIAGSLSREHARKKAPAAMNARFERERKKKALKRKPSSAAARGRRYLALRRADQKALEEAARQALAEGREEQEALGPREGPQTGQDP